jgi:DNA-binding winged helix-turn-helix (wHTH) protein
MQAVRGEAFYFEGYTLDLRRGCLRHEDREIELRPKSFTVLRYLLENAGRLVSKDELIRAVWPNVVVTDESLTRCVSDVRVALEDHEQRIIKTVPRRGYLLAAPISQTATNTGSIDDEPHTRDVMGQSSTPTQSTALPLPDKPSIAVALTPVGSEARSSAPTLSPAPRQRVGCAARSPQSQRPLRRCSLSP